MKAMRTKGKSYADIDPDDVFVPAIVVLILIAIIAVIVCVLYALSTVIENAEIPTYNMKVAEFNMLPLNDRCAIATWTKDDTIDPETYLMAEKTPNKVFLLAEIYDHEDARKTLLFCLVVLLMALSACVFAGYLHERDHSYYICSLPFDTPYGWILFFCMFTGWPVLLVSFVWMRVQHSEFCRDQRQKRQAKRQQKRATRKSEKAEVQRLAEEELADIARELTKPLYPRRAREALLAYITNGQRRAHEARVREAEEKVVAARRLLQETGETVRAAQQSLGRARAGLEQLQAFCLEAQSNEKAEADWAAIKNARGVSSMVYNRRKQRLEILIKVRVPYKGELYDFGDYVLYLDGGSTCTCKEVRSGRKLNYDNTAPLYHLSGKRFCFGDSLCQIEQYLGEGRYAEAVILVVECLHSVNSEYDAKQIPGCFRKVSTVEKAKQRILRRNKLKFWQKGVKNV